MSSTAPWVGQGIWLGYPELAPPNWLAHWVRARRRKGTEGLPSSPSLPAPVGKVWWAAHGDHDPGRWHWARAHAARQVSVQVQSPLDPAMGTLRTGHHKGSKPVAGSPLFWCLPSCQAEPGEGKGGTLAAHAVMECQGTPVSWLSLSLARARAEWAAAEERPPHSVVGAWGHHPDPTLPQACMCACGLRRGARELHRRRGGHPQCHHGHPSEPCGPEG